MVIIIVVAAALAALVLGAAVALLILRRRVLGASLPRVRGTLEISAVGEPVHIDRDRHGIPHVAAGSMPDAAFAMGLLHAQDRLWQLELLRRTAMGRVSEFAGPEGLGIDRFVRRLGLHRVAREEARLATGDAARMLLAYAAGVNAGIDTARRLPIEFRLLSLHPEPWEPAHSLAVVKLLALGLSMNWDAEWQRLRLLRAIGAERAARLDVVYPDANPTIIAATAAAAAHSGEQNGELAAFVEAARWIPTAGGGSNSWVVAGSQTATGRPLLCNDPHLAPGLPSIWYAAHVRAGDDFEATGVTLPGMPFVVIGHNRRCAWGFTNSFADCQDLVIEEFDSPAAQRHRTASGFEATRVLREVIHVKDASDELEEVVLTRHGPVVERIDDPARNVWRGLALQWTALAPGSTAEGMLLLQRAGDWPAFREAMVALDTPSQNAVYADVDGHIGYVLSGRIPVRRRAPSGLPTPGWTGEAQWARFLRPAEMPALVDPAEGRIVTANNRIVGEEFPHYVATDYMNGYRALRITELLSAGRADAAYMNRMQLDVVCPPARQAVRLLRTFTCPTPEAERLRRRLVAWDAEMSATASEPTIYEAFMRRLTERWLRPWCGDSWSIAAGTTLTHPVFDYPGNLIGRITPGLLAAWEAGDTSLLDGGTWPQTAGRALDEAWYDLRAAYGRPGRRWSWGRVHAIPLRHPFSRRRPLGALFRDGDVRVGGGADTVMATSHMPGEPFATRMFAPSWRQVIDVGNWDACTGVHYPGQSGQPGSRHYRDLIGRWLRNDQYTLHWSPEQIRRNTRDRLTLVPSPAAAIAGDEKLAA